MRGLRARRVLGADLRPGMRTGRTSRIATLVRRPIGDGHDVVLCSIKTQGARSATVAKFRLDETVTVYERPTLD